MKEYVKPGFYFEKFELSNYAAGCSVGAGVTNASDGNTCVYNIEGLCQIFNPGSSCKTYLDSLGALEGYCYQNGSEGVSVTWS